VVFAGIGLLCTSLAEHGASFNGSLEVRAWPRFAFHLGFVPFQLLKRSLDFIVTEANFQYLQQTRTALAGIASLDKPSYLAAQRSVPAASRNALIAAQTLEPWSAAKDVMYYNEGDGKCDQCGSEQAGLLHEAWDCPALKATPLEKDPDLQHPSSHPPGTASPNGR
jgi:hypothetical protein